MDDFWNSQTLRPPLINTFKCKVAIDIKSVTSILENAIDTFMIPNALRVESNVMRRVIYRLKLQFRLDKGFKLFENTNRNLNKLFSFNLTKDLMYLLNEVPKKYNKDFYFPSKQMLEYVLVRLQAYSQICSRVVETAFNCAMLMKGRARLGHQWEIAVVVIAICSRIWQICRHLTTQCCLVYSELLPLLDKLEIAGSKWLPDNYQFPNDLIEWLNYDWLHDKPDVILQLPLELPIFSLLDDDDDYAKNTLNKSKTIIIPDGDDVEDNLNNVNFVCSLSKSYVKLDRRQLKILGERILPTFNPGSESATSSNYSNVFKNPIKNHPLYVIDSDENDVDEDVQIIEETQNSKEAAYLIEDDEVIEIDDTFTVEVEDSGEIITRENLLKNNLQEQEEDEFSDEKAQSSDNDVSEFQDEIENTEVPVVSKKKKKKKVASQKDIPEDIPLHVTLKGFMYRMNSGEVIQKFLTKENELRNNSIYPECQSKKSKPSVSSHLSDEDWHCLSYEIRYYIAAAIFNEENPKNKSSKPKYVCKAQQVLKNYLDTTETGYTLTNLLEEPVPLTFHGRKYFIDFLKTLPDLKIFLKQESELRTQAPDNCFFSKLNNDDWNKVCNEIKYLMLVASNKPIKSIIYIKKAQEKLKKLCKKYIEDDDLLLHSDDDVEDHRKKYNGKLENESIPEGRDSLFDLVSEIKNYTVPHKKYVKKEKLSKKEQKKIAKLEAEMKNIDKTEVELQVTRKNNKRKLKLKQMQRRHKRRKLCNYN